MIAMSLIARLLKCVVQAHSDQLWAQLPTLSIASKGSSCFTSVENNIASTSFLSASSNTNFSGCHGHNNVDLSSKCRHAVT